MAKKIQIVGVEMTSKAQVIMLNAYLVAKAVRAEYELDHMLEMAKYEAKEFNHETKEYEPVLDENGKQVIEYHDINGKWLAEDILPFLKELVDAFEDADELYVLPHAYYRTFKDKRKGE